MLIQIIPSHILRRMRSDDSSPPDRLIAATSIAVFALCLPFGCRQAPADNRSFIIASDSKSDAPTHKNVEFQRFSYQQIIMGGKASLTLYAPDQESAKAAARDAFQAMNRLDAVLSDYRSNSESMLACAIAKDASPTTHVAVHISSELADAIKKSQHFSEITNGAFDLTVGPFSKLWRSTKKTNVKPDPLTLSIAKQSVGFRKITTSNTPLVQGAQIVAHKQPPPEPGTYLIFHAPNMRLDFGGIGKGLAADEALRILHQNHHITRALINMGGDLRIGDPPPGRNGWSILIETFNPDHPDQNLTVTNCAVATSGDLEQFIELDNIRFSHIINPATGLGLSQRIASTVIAPNAATADALASATCVLGISKSIRLIEQLNEIEARIATINSTGLTSIATSAGFPRQKHKPRDSPIG